MKFKEFLSIPYLLEVCSFPGPDGFWYYRAENPELPGVVVEANSTLEAFDRLDEKRTKYIIQQLELGKSVPVPRPPLYATDPTSELKKFGLTQYMDWLDLDTDEIAGKRRA